MPGNRLLVLAGVVVALMVSDRASSVAAFAVAGSPTVSVSVTGDQLGLLGGKTVDYSSTTDSVTLTRATTSQISLSAGPAGDPGSTGTPIQPLSLDFSTTDASAFRTGLYGDLADTRAVGRRIAPVSLHLLNDGRSCDETGRVQVNDIAFDAGEISRLDLTFVAHCGGDLAADLGEVRIGVPDPSGDHLSNGTVQWPDTDARTGATPVPISITNTSGADQTIDAPVSTGRDAQSFAVLASDCDRLLLPGQSCTTTVGFLPGVPVRSPRSSRSRSTAPTSASPCPERHRTGPPSWISTEPPTTRSRGERDSPSCPRIHDSAWVAG